MTPSVKPAPERLRRSLKNRHLQMIAIGGAVGTGLFYGSAHVLALTGPSIILGYAVVGTVIYFLMRALGEMAVAEPVAGSFSVYARRYCGDFAGFLSGWTYWFCCLAVSMAELAVIGIYVRFWFPDLPAWVPALVCWAAVTGVNLTRVRLFGEVEFWSALLKVAAIVLMVLLGTWLILADGFAGRLPEGLTAMRTMGDLFPRGVAGFVLSFALIVFSFGGIELIGVTAGEAAEPGRALPQAIRAIVWRILLFYIATFTVMLLYFPWPRIGLEGSPFVQVFAQSGIPRAASLVNLVVLSAAVSVYNSQLFSNGRMLYSLALQGDAPSIFGQVNGAGVPGRAVAFSSMMAFLGVGITLALPGRVFLLAAALASSAILINWLVILWAHRRFRQRRSLTGETSAFPLPLYPWASYGAALFLGLTLVLLGFIPDMRLSLLFIPLWLIGLKVAHGMQRRGRRKNEG